MLFSLLYCLTHILGVPV